MILTDLNKPDVLVETALLTHGLSSVSNEELLRLWPYQDKFLAFIENGEIKITDMKEYLFFRDKCYKARIDYQNLQEYINNKKSGPLTASGTMAVANLLGIKAAVTCGMGGIGDIRGEELCPDLPALSELPVKLVATSPKDMLDIKGTIEWLLSHKVDILGVKDMFCTGFVFNKEPVKLTDILNQNMKNNHTLILNGIDKNKRLTDLTILEEAIKAGKKAEKNGKHFHPAANAMIDKLSGGYISRLQIQSLINNIKLAKNLFKK